MTVLDSAGTEWEEMAGFTQLAEALSSKWPVVVVEMSDSAALTLSLHIDRKMVDRYQNLKPPFFAFHSDEEAQMVRGDPLVWSRMFNAPSDNLRSIWRQGLDSRPHDILPNTGRLLGWHPLLCQVGYTVDYDGCPVDFDEHYSDLLDQLSDVERLHFQNPPTHASKMADAPDSRE
ncbi:MAG: hypothetical protein K8T91_22425 [Planctomycetes bacterium]|nr:hypothetical protein [Planctomycetota bacterium]